MSGFLHIQSAFLIRDRVVTHILLGKDSGPVFLSGPAGQGKETMAGLLVHWYAQQPASFPDTRTTAIVYQWAGNPKPFFSLHLVEKGSCCACFGEGEFVEPAWEEEQPTSLKAWQHLLASEGYALSPALPDAESWLRWLTGDDKVLPAKFRKAFPSPSLSASLVRQLRFRPEPEPNLWRKNIDDLFHARLALPEEFVQLLLAYADDRTRLQREETLSQHLPHLRQLQHRHQQTRHERGHLTAQLHEMKRLLRSGVPDRQEVKTLRSATALVKDQLEALEARLGWLSWRLDDPANSPSGKPSGSFSPATWWETRKLLQQEHDRCLRLAAAGRADLPVDSPGKDEDRITARLKQMDTQLPQKVAALEQGKMKLEWLRKEKEEELQLLQETHRQEIARWSEEKKRLEDQLSETEADARRPRNTFRHWLDQNVPDWKAGPGRLLHPEVLDNRGLLPKIERINDLFFGISLHLEDLPEVAEANHTPASTLQQQLAAVRKQLATCQIQFSHEEKLLQARFRQKTRPQQKILQTAEYELQQFHKEQAQLRQHLREAASLRRQQWQKQDLHIRYEAEAAWQEAGKMAAQLAELDLAWEQWLAKEDPFPAVSVLKKLKSSWQKEKTNLEKKLSALHKELQKAEQKKEAEIAAWEEARQFIHNIQLDEPEDSEEEPAPASLRPAEWVKRYRLLQAEEAACLLESADWTARFPQLRSGDGSLDFDLLDELEPERLEARKSMLAHEWFPQIGKLLDLARPVLDASAKIDQLWENWADLWQTATSGTSMESDAPTCQFGNHPMIRALQGMRELQLDHQHAVAGPSLFNHHDPGQTLIRTLHLLDNLFEGWGEWQHESHRWLRAGMNLPGLHDPHRRHVYNLLYHVSCIFAQMHQPMGPVFLPDGDQIFPAILEKLSAAHNLIITSQWPLAVAGQHLWVTRQDQAQAWEALPFAVG